MRRRRSSDDPTLPMNQSREITLLCKISAIFIGLILTYLNYYLLLTLMDYFTVSDIDHGPISFLTQTQMNEFEHLQKEMAQRELANVYIEGKCKITLEAESSSRNLLKNCIPNDDDPKKGHELMKFEPEYLRDGVRLLLMHADAVDAADPARDKHFLSKYADLLLNPSRSDPRRLELIKSALDQIKLNMEIPIESFPGDPPPPPLTSPESTFADMFELSLASDSSPGTVMKRNKETFTKWSQVLNMLKEIINVRLAHDKELRIPNVLRMFVIDPDKLSEMNIKDWRFIGFEIENGGYNFWEALYMKDSYLPGKSFPTKINAFINGPVKTYQVLTNKDKGYQMMHIDSKFLNFLVKDDPPMMPICDFGASYVLSSEHQGNAYDFLSIGQFHLLGMELHALDIQKLQIIPEWALKNPKQCVLPDEYDFKTKIGLRTIQILKLFQQDGSCLPDLHASIINLVLLLGQLCPALDKDGVLRSLGQGRWPKSIHYYGTDVLSEWQWEILDHWREHRELKSIHDLFSELWPPSVVQLTTSDEPSDIDFKELIRIFDDDEVFGTILGAYNDYLPCETKGFKRFIELYEAIHLESLSEWCREQATSKAAKVELPI